MLSVRFTGIALVATALLSAGCGSSGNSNSTSSSSKELTSAAIAARANAICRNVASELAAHRVNSVAGIARVAPYLASVEEAASIELSKLTPPAAVAGDWKQFLTSTRTLAYVTSKYAEYARANNIKGMHAILVATENTLHQGAAAATRRGLGECAHLV